MELNTKQKAILEARRLVSLYGYHGFSFQQIADSLGIKKPSLFAHFESKEDMGMHLIEEYKTRMNNWMESVSTLDPRSKIIALFDLFYKLAKEDMYCPIAALTAEMNTLPAPIQEQVHEIYEHRMNWVIKVIGDGQKVKIFRQDIKAKDLGSFVYSVIIGVQSLARVRSEDSIRNVQMQILDYLDVQ